MAWGLVLTDETLRCFFLDTFLAFETIQSKSPSTLIKKSQR